MTEERKPRKKPKLDLTEKEGFELYNRDDPTGKKFKRIVDFASTRVGKPITYIIGRLADQKGERSFVQAAEKYAKQKFEGEDTSDASLPYKLMYRFKKGGMPDLTGDGKVTQADVLKGRGVFMKGGMKKKRNANIDYRKSGMFYVGGMSAKTTPINKGKK